MTAAPQAEVVLYRSRYCAYCLLAARLLGSHAIPFREVDVSADPERRRWLARASGQRTLPQIFVGERSVGGYAELRELLEDGPEALFDWAAPASAAPSREAPSEEAIVGAGAQPEQK